MKIKVDRKELADAMSVVASVVNPRHTNPLIQNVLLDATKSGLTLRATDLEISIQLTVDKTTVSKPGKILLPAARLSSLVKDMNAETVEISQEEDNVTLKGERDKITLQTSDSEGFPSFPVFKSDGSFEMRASDIESGLSWTGKSISPERGRYAFNGVLITPGKNSVEFCGTDGRRLSLRKCATKAKEVKFPVIVPRRGVDLLQRMAQRNPEAMVSLDLRENELVARVENTIISTALIDGQYPDYWTVIPRNHDKKLVARRSELISGLKLAGHVTSIESQTVAFEVSKDELTLRTRSPGMGSAEVRVPITYNGPDQRIGFDPRYLIDGLSLMQGDDVTCEFKDGDAGVIFHEGDKDKAFYLVMPLDVG